MNWGAINLHQLMKQGLVRKLGILLWFVTHAVYLYFVIIVTDIAGLHLVEHSLWNRVPHYLRRVSSSLKKVHANSTCEGLGASRPPSILIRRRPSNAGRETPEPRLFLTLGLVPFPVTVTRAGTVTHWAGKPWRQAGPGWLHSPSYQEHSEGFFSHRRGNSPRWGFECRRLLRTTRANNLRLHSHIWNITYENVSPKILIPKKPLWPVPWICLFSFWAS